MAAENFFIFLLTIFLVSLASASLSYAISARVGVFAVANLLSAMTYVFFMVSNLQNTESSACMLHFLFNILTNY